MVQALNIYETKDFVVMTEMFAMLRIKKRQNVINEISAVVVSVVVLFLILVIVLEMQYCNP